MSEVLKIVLGLTLIVSMFLGYIFNAVALFKCDFEPIGKAEVIRTIGVFVPPLGVIAGYMDIEDK